MHKRWFNAGKSNNGGCRCSLFLDSGKRMKNSTIYNSFYCFFFKFIYNNYLYCNFKVMMIYVCCISLSDLTRIKKIYIHTETYLMNFYTLRSQRFFYRFFFNHRNITFNKFVLCDHRVYFLMLISIDEYQFLVVIKRN